MDKKLNGKSALITGGSSGLGLATAQLFAAHGSRVIITGRRQSELDAALPLIRGDVAIQGDISTLSDLDRLYDQIRKTVGRIDVLFANASGGAYFPLGQITEEHSINTSELV